MFVGILGFSRVLGLQVSLDFVGCSLSFLDLQQKQAKKKLQIIPFKGACNIVVRQTTLKNKLRKFRKTL